MSRRTPHDRQLLQPRQDHEERDEPRMKARQVRRRLHTTSRPFQGRLLDMAEARREIAAALRIHRAAAAVRRSGDQHEQQQKQLSQPQQQQEQMQTQWRPPAVSCDAFFSGHLCDSPLADFIAAGAGCSSSSTLRYLTPVAVAPPVAIGGGVDHLSCSLPAQPLGLSLSFQGFADSSVHDDVKNSDDSWDSRLIQPLPASSCSVCSSPLAAAMLSHDGSPAFGTAADNAPSSATALRPVLEGDQEGAAAVYPIGERRSDDAVDVATPAWWGDLLGDQSTEGVGGGEVGAPAGQEGGGAVVVAGTPAAGWLWDSSGEQGITASGKPDGVPEMHLDDDDDYHHGDDGDGEDITLPCMEIEGWDDGEWFSS